MLKSLVKCCFESKLDFFKQLSRKRVTSRVWFPHTYFVFPRFFELAPVTVNVYSFGSEFQGNEESLFESAKFKQHACAVMEMLDQAVNML